MNAGLFIIILIGDWATRSLAVGFHTPFENRAKRASPGITSCSISSAGNRLNGYDENVPNNVLVQSSSIFCQSQRLTYPLKSIVVNNAQSMSATLTAADQSTRDMRTAKLNGSLLVFDNPPVAQCYRLYFSPRIRNSNAFNTNNVQVQFIYDSCNRPITPTGIDYGYTGGFATNTNAVCGSIVCRNGGACQRINSNVYQCQCGSSGQWLGVDCSKPNPCTASTCNRRGQCYYRSDASFYCTCYAGYSGANCQYSTSQMPVTTTMSPSYSCSGNRRCLNGGTCEWMGNKNGFICVCRSGFTGVNCQSSTNPTPAPTISSNMCGQSDELDRIVNGQPVYTRAWPWIVSLQTSPGGSHFCGGTLIDDMHVVTAAHCFGGSNASPAKLKVVAGLLNLRQMNAAGVQQLAVERIFLHEQYNSQTLTNDIALIKLRTRAQASGAVKYICLPSTSAQDPLTNANVQIAGWGYMSSATKQLAQQLQQATIQVLDINGDLYGGPGCNTWGRQGLAVNGARQICAMSRDTRTDSCQGDSGGPLMGKNKSQWFLFGIVSFGDVNCASSTAAGVYTRVSAYIPWIQQKLRL